MNQRNRKIFRILCYAGATIASLLLILAIFAAGAVLWAYKNPESVYGIVERNFFPDDLKITWSKVEFDGKTMGGLDFAIDLTLEQLKIEKASPQLDLPIDHVHLRAAVFPLRRSLEIEALEATASSTMTFKAAEETSSRGAKNPFEQLQSLIRIFETVRDRVPIENVDVRAEAFEFHPFAKEKLRMAVAVTKVPQRPLKFVYRLELPGEKPFDVIAAGELVLENVGQAAKFLNAEVSLEGAGISTKQKFEAVSDDSQTVLTSSGDIVYRKAKTAITIRPKLSIRMTENEAVATLDGNVAGIPGPLVDIDKIRAKVTTPLESGIAWSEKASHFSVTAPIKLFFVSPPNRLVLEKTCACKLPEVLEVKVDGKAYLSTLLGGQANGPVPLKTALDAVIAVETLENKIFALDFKGGVKAEIERTNDQNKYFFSPSVDCEATVRSFKALKTFLDANGIVIPAPLDVLDGSLSFTADGPVATDAKGSKFPLRLAIDLASTGQKVKADTEASVNLNSQFTALHLDVKAKIANLFLDLPPLKPLDGLPRIANDSRIIKEPPKKKDKAKFTFSFNFEIQTEAPDSIRLKSQYFNPYLPLNLKIQAGTGGENTGFIAIQPFDISYLRRTVHVENLTLNLDGDEKEPMPIKGRFSVKQTDYTVFIDVDGNTKNPNVILSSDPYLPNNEIISVLLYDRTSEQLQSGEAETGGSVQAAIADRAVGLFGLWAFAATPIKSFSYNPVSKVYSATIAVSDDLTAGIGTSWESAAHLELRKRVSKRWSLTAAWTPASEEESASSKLVLQWERRF